MSCFAKRPAFINYFLMIRKIFFGHKWKEGW